MSSSNWSVATSTVSQFAWSNCGLRDRSVGFPSVLREANSAISLGAIVMRWEVSVFLWLLPAVPELSSCWISMIDIVSAGFFWWAGVRGRMVVAV